MHMDSCNLLPQGGWRQAVPAAWEREKNSSWSTGYKQIRGHLDRKISLASRIQQLQKQLQCEGNGLAWSGHAHVLNAQSLFLQTEGQAGWITSSILLGISSLTFSYNGRIGVGEMYNSRVHQGIFLSVFICVPSLKSHLYWNCWKKLLYSCWL